jgi:hypothetical protein
MRVVLALGSENLTTKQLRKRLPDVAQASLYRAIARLVDVGIVAVVEHRQRGGAMERVYRVAQGPDGTHSMATTHGFVAAADTLARALSVDAAQWASDPDWRAHEAHLRRDVLHLSPEQFSEFKNQLNAHVERAIATQDENHAKAMVVTVAAIPASAKESRADSGR